jgi:hypothetical protein
VCVCVCVCVWIIHLRVQVFWNVTPYHLVIVPVS